MYFAVGIITGLSLISSLYAVFKNKKIVGILQMVITIVFPIVLKAFCLLKYSMVYGDTDWKFLLQTAFIDGLIEPWLLLILFLIIIIFTSKSLFNMFKKISKNKSNYDRRIDDAIRHNFN